MTRRLCRLTQTANYDAVALAGIKSSGSSNRSRSRNSCRSSKAERNHWQEKRQHHACAYAEPRLCCWSKAPDDRVDDHDVHKEQQKLRAGWYTDPQHSSPNFCLRAKQRKTKTQIMIFPFE